MSLIQVDIAPDVDPVAFARWGLCKITSNVKRAMLAEYLVARALGVVSEFHEQWEDYDLRYGTLRVEVKSSGHVTPPFPTRFLTENPRFDIEKRQAYWSSAQNSRLSYDCPVRPADIYIFALHEARTEAEFRPFDTRQWRFLVATRDRLDSHFANQKSASLTRIAAIATCSDFHGLREAVDQTQSERTQ